MDLIQQEKDAREIFFNDQDDVMRETSEQFRKRTQNNYSSPQVMKKNEKNVS